MRVGLYYDIVINYIAVLICVRYIRLWKSDYNSQPYVGGALKMLRSVRLSVLHNFLRVFAWMFLSFLKLTFKTYSRQNLRAETWHNKKAVLSQRWPRDAPTKVNKQPHLHLRSRDSCLGWLSSTGRYARRCWTNIFSPKFLHVPLGICGWPLGYEERRSWAVCSRN